MVEREQKAVEDSAVVEAGSSQLTDTVSAEVGCAQVVAC